MALKHPEYAHGISDAELMKEALEFCDEELAGFIGMEYDSDSEVCCQRSDTFIRELVHRLQLLSAAPYPVSAADAGEDKIGPHEQALRDTVEPFLDWLDQREEGAHIKEVREGLIGVEDVIPDDHVVLGAHPRAQKDQGVLTIGHFRRLRDAYDGNDAPADTGAAQSARRKAFEEAAEIADAWTSTTTTSTALVIAAAIRQRAEEEGR